MSLEEETKKCSRIHDILAEHWNWAYYDSPHGECSWLLSEYVERLKPDIDRRAPVMITELDELLNKAKNSFSILDVGCGVGGFIERAMSSLEEKHPNVELKVTGIDISREMIEYAQKNLQGKNVELLCDTITDHELEMKNEPFDVAIMMVTLSFYNDENAKEILSAINRRLGKGGSLLVMDFAWTYSWGGFELFSKPLKKLTDMFFSHLIGETFHFRNRKEDQLMSLLTESGYEIVQSYLTEEQSKMKGMLVIHGLRGS